jgi:pimeloyl-ACP methyl ester carboxylesterase
MSSYNPPAPYPVLVHSYLPSISSSAHQSPEQQRPIQTYEHLPSDAISNSNWNTLPRAENALIFVGGLGDGPHTIPYVRTLATHLFGSALLPLSSRYSVFEARLSSAFSAFGHASLAQDARELADLVRYLRVTLGKKKVVIMGHSTGCQDCMEYATRFLAEFRGDAEEEMKASVRVDGLILQGPVSDRQAIAMAEDPAEVKACLETAEEMVRQGRATDVIPTGKMPAGWNKVPMTAYRWISLAGVG